MLTSALELPFPGPQARLSSSLPSASVVVNPSRLAAFFAVAPGQPWGGGQSLHTLIEPSRHRLVTLLLCGKAEASPPLLLFPPSPPEDH